MSIVRLPPAAPGLRVGLYGGSFSPAHAGHRHVALAALRRLRLDRLWWLVTPGNPLKDPAALDALAARVAGARAVSRHPRIVVTAFEAAIGARYTLDTLRYLARRRPGVRFVWIMGADSLAGFHRWRGWEEIAALVPIAVVDRPGYGLRAVRSPAAARLAPWRVDERAAPGLADRAPPAWTFLHGPLSPLSSTALRTRRRGPALNAGTGPPILGGPRDAAAAASGMTELSPKDCALRGPAHEAELAPPQVLSEPTPIEGGDPRAVALAAIEDMKAENTVEIDLVGKTSIADAMIITSGRSQRHVGSIAERVTAGLKARGIGAVRVEGMPACDWVLIDAGDLIVHIFRPEVRGFYNLEKMWGDDRPSERAAG